jgi:uncharacterized protein (DUF433 family)
MARTRTFRLSEELLTSLEQRSHEHGDSVNALAERYLEEGLRRENHPLIDFRDSAAGRRAMLVGTRLEVKHVIDTWLNSDKSVEDTAEYFNLPEGYVRAAVQYYAAFQDEVDEWRERMLEFADRAEAAWRREQALLK